ncbi:hypothetical protein Tco_0276162 [Tanacetum coccineum]
MIDFNAPQERVKVSSACNDNYLRASPTISLTNATSITAQGQERIQLLLIYLLSRNNTGDALLDKVEIKTEETTVEPQVVASENINVINLTLQESLNQCDKKNSMMKKSVDLEEYLGLFDESDQEEDLGEDDSDQDDSDDGWV